MKGPNGWIGIEMANDRSDKFIRARPRLAESAQQERAQIGGCAEGGAFLEAANEQGLCFLALLEFQRLPRQGERSLVPATSKLNQRKVVGRKAVFELQRPVQLRRGEVKFAAFPQYVPQIIVRLGKILFERYRSAELRDGSVEHALLAQSNTELVVSYRRAGDRRGTPKVADSLLQLALKPENLTQAAVDDGQIRLGGQNPGVDRCRLIEFALGVDDVAEILLRFEKRRLQFRCPGKMMSRPIQFAKAAMASPMLL